MIGTPDRTEASAHYFTYIDKALTDDILGHLDAQTSALLAFFATISEEQSLHRYGPDKWSFREVLNHISDTERVFAFRAFWFARGDQGPLPGFDQDKFAANSGADRRSWADHIAEFQAVRGSTMACFQSFGDEDWLKTGVASNNPITVRALVYAVAGHAEHHRRLLVERYFN